MLETKIEAIGAEALEVLGETLRRAGELGAPRWVRREVGAPSDPGYDLSAEVLLKNGQRWQLRAIVKVVAHPKQVRQAVWELKRQPDQGTLERPAYSVVIAPYLSPAVAKICEEEQIGHLDLSGNCDLEFGGVWIRVENKENKYKEERTIRNLFSAKSSRILRVLLQGPLVGHKVADLARKSGVSLGLVSRVRRHLLEQELAEEEAEGIRIRRPREILASWLLADDLDVRTESRDYSVLETDPTTIARGLSKTLDQHDIPHAYTQWFAGWLRAPHVTPPVVTAYVREFPDDKILKRELKANRVGKGAGRLRLLKSKDHRGVTIGSQKVRGLPLVSDLQIYLDLHEAGRHGGEQARELSEAEDFSGGWR